MKNKLLILSIYIFLGGFFLLFPKFSYAVMYKDVVCSEIMWMGSESSYTDEWLELKNTTSQNIDLSGWQITYLKNEVETLMLAIPSGIIPANGYFLISRNEQNKIFTDGESILNIEPDLVDSSIVLSNSKLQLKVYDGQWNNNHSPIDIIGDGGIPLAGDNDEKISMERELSPITEGNLIDSWENSHLIERENLDANSFATANPHNSGKPVIKNSNLNPRSIFLKQGESKDLKFELEIRDSSDIKEVSIDLSPIGGLINQPLYDDGTNGDKTASDGIYSLTYPFTLSNVSNQIGLKNFIIRAENNSSLVSNSNFEFFIYQLSDDLIISEILPRPQDGSSSEFIELYNRGSSMVNLYGWQLDDEYEKGSSPYKLDNLVINSQSYLVINKSNSKISLNDSGDTVRLINPQNLEQAVVRYAEKPDKGVSYIFFDNNWQWSNQNTASSENIFDPVIKKTYQNEVNMKINNLVSSSQNSISEIESGVGEIKITKSNTQIMQADNQTIGRVKSLSTENTIIDQILDRNISQNERVARQKQWIKITEYVIVITSVICIILLFLSLGYYEKNKVDIS